MFSQIFMPIAFFILAGCIYFGLTDPIINGEGPLSAGAPNIVELRQEKAALNQALKDSEALKDRAADLEAQIRAISPDNIARLDDFLPDSVDDLQLVVDIDGIARQSNMTVSDVKLGGDVNIESALQSDGTAAAATVIPEVATVPVSFTVTGTYPDLQGFIANISKSLRILEVTKLEFTSVEGGAAAQKYKYQITVETYWLK